MFLLPLVAVGKVVLLYVKLLLAVVFGRPVKVFAAVADVFSLRFGVLSAMSFELEEAFVFEILLCKLSVAVADVMGAPCCEISDL